MVEPRMSWYICRTDGAGEALRTGAFYSKARPVTQHVSLRFQKKTSSGYKIGKRSAGVPCSHNSRASWKHKKGIKGILPFIVAIKLAKVSFRFIPTPIPRSIPSASFPAVQGLAKKTYSQHSNIHAHLFVHFVRPQKRMLLLVILVPNLCRPLSWLQVSIKRVRQSDRHRRRRSKAR